MARKQHLSRLAAPRTWPLQERKGIKWIAKPSPGPHKLSGGFPILVLLRDILKIVKTSKQTKQILNSKDVLVNGRPIHETRFSVGLFDVISLPKLKKNYRIILNNRGKLMPVEINQSESNILLLQIKNKTIISKGRIQLNFSNGWNQIVNNKSYKTGDVLIYDFSAKKTTKHLKLEKGWLVYFIKGKHAGNLATLNTVKEVGLLRKKKMAILKSGKETFETTLDNLVVVGKTSSEVKLEI